jgi:pseudaminic acid cytidylyltransferase
VTDAVRHAAEWLAESGTPANQLTLIYPTSPMLRPDDLQQAQARFDEAPNAPYLMSITTFPYPIDRALLDDKNGLRMRWPEHRMTRSQNLPDCFHDAALFIFGHCEAWRNGIDVFGQGTLGYRVPRHCVQDIDTLEDWGHAEAMMKAQGLDASD